MKSWSSTQKNVKWRGAGDAAVDVVSRSPMTASIVVDSSAALAVVARKGNGKLRHVRVGHLWVQQVAADGGLKYHKVN